MTGSKTWSMVKSLKRRDQTLTDQKDIANYFAEHFSKNSSSSNYDPRFARTKDNSEHIYRSLPWPENSMNSDINKPFSWSELSEVIRGRKGTSPGLDGIGYPMIANLPTSCLEKLLNLFNRLWSEGKCPETWRHSIIIPILKNAKLDNHSPASYRPISLTSNLCKIMERMINNRLRWWLENNNILQPCQSGFRTNRSTKDCIMLLHDHIYKALANKRSTLAVFLDIEKAYDMVWRDGLLHKMRSIGICVNMLRWIRSFLGKRKFQVRIGTCFSDTFSLENGIPQGSVLSPLLFAIMINDFPTSTGAEINIFADDSCIWDTGLDIQNLIENLQKSLVCITEWCNTWGFRISPSKST